MQKEDKIKKLSQFTKNPDLAIHTELVEIHEVLESLDAKEAPEMPEMPSMEATNKLLSEIKDQLQQPWKISLKLK